MPSTAHLLAFAATALVLILIPGPSLLFTIGRALTVGRRTALLSVLGNGLGVAAQVILVAVGLGAVVTASALAYSVLKFAGAAYLVWLGISAWRHRRDVATALLEGRSTIVSSRRAITTGFTVGASNPKTAVFLTALLPQFVDRGAASPSVQLLILGGLFVAMAIVCDSCWALVAGRARDWFATSPRRLERVGGGGGLMLITLGTGLALSGRPD